MEKEEQIAILLSKSYRIINDDKKMVSIMSKYPFVGDALLKNKTVLCKIVEGVVNNESEDDIVDDTLSSSSASVVLSLGIFFVFDELGLCDQYCSPMKFHPLHNCKELDAMGCLYEIFAIDASHIEAWGTEDNYEYEDNHDERQGQEIN